MSVNHSKNIIELQNVSFSYGDRQVLRDISFNIHEGDYLGVIGPNGGGKTTLLKLLLGLLPLTQGSVQLFGKPISQFHEWTNVGYVAQKSTQFDSQFPITVKDVVSMGRISKRGLFRRLTKEDETIIDWAIDHTGLQEHATTLIGNLSGGQQQKVFIARALAQKPLIIFLDEPTAGIDTSSQEQFYALLEKLNHTLGITLVLVSHDIDVVVSEVTEVACINQRLVYHGTPKDFAKDDYLKQLYGKEMKFIVHSH